MINYLDMEMDRMKYKRAAHIISVMQRATEIMQKEFFQGYTPTSADREVLAECRLIPGSDYEQAVKSMSEAIELVKAEPKVLAV